MIGETDRFLKQAHCEPACALLSDGAKHSQNAEISCASKTFAMLRGNGMLFIVSFCLRIMSLCCITSKDVNAVKAFDDCGVKSERGSSPLGPFSSPGTIAFSSLPRLTKPCAARLRSIGYRSKPSRIRLLLRHLLHHRCWRSHCP